jgi:hypothetical protein
MVRLLFRTPPLHHTYCICIIITPIDIIDEKQYEAAWELSKGSYPRAKRALGKFHLDAKNVWIGLAFILSITCSYTITVYSFDH